MSLHRVCCCGGDDPPSGGCDCQNCTDGPFNQWLLNTTGNVTVEDVGTIIWNISVGFSGGPIGQGSCNFLAYPFLSPWSGTLTYTDLDGDETVFSPATPTPPGELPLGRFTGFQCANNGILANTNDWVLSFAAGQVIGFNMQFRIEDRIPAVACPNDFTVSGFDSLFSLSGLPQNITVNSLTWVLS